MQQYIMYAGPSVVRVTHLFDPQQFSCKCDNVCHACTRFVSEVCKKCQRHISLTLSSCCMPVIMMHQICTAAGELCTLDPFAAIAGQICVDEAPMKVQSLKRFQDKQASYCSPDRSHCIQNYISSSTYCQPLVVCCSAWVRLERRWQGHCTCGCVSGWWCHMDRC